MNPTTPDLGETIDGIQLDAGDQRAVHEQHAVGDVWRGARRRPEVTGSCTDRLVSTEQQTVDPQLVLSALRTLSDDHRQVLVECYYRGASVAEAAQSLGVPPSTVMSRTHDALHGLRRAIEAAVPGRYP